MKFKQNGGKLSLCSNKLDQMLDRITKHKTETMWQYMKSVGNNLFEEEIGNENGVKVRKLWFTDNRL